MNRQPEGIPTGGQFAASAKSEPDIALTAPAHWIRIERDRGPDLMVGPYPSEESAGYAMEHSLLITGFEDDMLGCDLDSSQPGESDEQVIVDLKDPHHTGVPAPARAVSPGEDDIEEFERLDSLRDRLLGVAKGDVERTLELVSGLLEREVPQDGDYYAEIEVGSAADHEEFEKVAALYRTMTTETEVRDASERALNLTAKILGRERKV